MAPRAYWKGYLKLSLVSCPIAIYPATSDREKVNFHQLNGKTGNRIRYRKVDAETGREVDSDDIVKGFEVRKGRYLELTEEELDAVAIEAKRVVEIEQFVEKTEIDDLYVNNPYFVVPDGDIGQQPFAVIREAIRQEGMVAIGKIVFTSREHVFALEPRGKGLMGVTLRYPYEVRAEKDYFKDIENERVPKDMLDLAKHIVGQKRTSFRPDKFEDHYEKALRQLIQKKQKGVKIEPPEQEEAPTKPGNLMEALRASLGSERRRRPASRRAAHARASRHPRRTSRARQKKAG